MRANRRFLAVLLAHTHSPRCLPLSLSKHNISVHIEKVVAVLCFLQYMLCLCLPALVYLIEQVPCPEEAAEPAAVG